MPLLSKHQLSKSTFMYGCQCPKRLWLHKFMPQVRDEMSEGQAAIFQQGTDVGMLARELFPGGVDASPATNYDYQQSVADTARYMQEGHSVIYEAAFQFEGILCAIDIMVKQNEKWVAYEVKSSTKVKPTFVQDASLQYHVITQSGIALSDIAIVHLNNEYVRQGPLDMQALFSISSIWNEVIELQDFITEKIVELKKVLKLKKAPDIEMGAHCNNPYACDFMGFCSEGIEVEEPDYGEVNIDQDALKEFVGELEYPLYFMDFETWMAAVPEYDGHWPYRSVPFQFSVHKQAHPNAAVEHFDYLAEGPESSQRDFAEQLMAVLGEQGSIVVYNIGFEKTRIRELICDFPHWEDALNTLNDRLVDLMRPFRSKHYYLPEMQGSYSIKKVLPALVPSLSYEHLTINNGGDASSIFYNLRKEEDAAKVKEIRAALREYCGLDTWAMVKILEKINEKLG
ncbi:MAG: DUF2779 domain-containing protein [Bacteroidetes bacterium]|nr:DUF2779 domain-containing protein [Bacteroidota bacterium]